MAVKSGALDTAMSLVGEPYAQTLFPFVNQTYDRQVPVPHQGEHKEWIHVKEFLETSCKNEDTSNFERLWEVGLCYPDHESTESEALAGTMTGTSSTCGGAQAWLATARM